MKYRVKRHEVTQPLNKPYRFIPLTQGQNAIVDAEDFEWLSKMNWTARYDPLGKTFYAVSGNTSMHRLILKCLHGEEGDHWNHNTLDNRRENLRKCTHSQNQRNRRKQKNNKSGFAGVSWKHKLGKWQARIQINGKQKHIGLFVAAEDAAKAYDKMAEILHGEFAHLNFPIA